MVFQNMDTNKSTSKWARRNKPKRSEASLARRREANRQRYIKIMSDPVQKKALQEKKCKLYKKIKERRLAEKLALGCDEKRQHQLEYPETSHDEHTGEKTGEPGAASMYAGNYGNN